MVRSWSFQPFKQKLLDSEAEAESGSLNKIEKAYTLCI